MASIARLGLIISGIFRRTAPDPLVLAILLTVATAALAIAFGASQSTLGATAAGVDHAGGEVAPSLLRRVFASSLSTFDAWRGDDGLWKLLAFAMQMCLVLVSGHALAAAAPVRRGLARLASLPSGTASATWMVATVSCAAGLVNWGLGLVTGAILAREVGRQLASRGIAAHYPLLCAAGYTCMLLWHGGLSGSAPLSVTTPQAAAAVMPPEMVSRLVGDGIPLSQTLFSPLNLFVSGGLLVIVPLALMLLAPRDPREMVAPPPSIRSAASAPTGAPAESDPFGDAAAAASAEGPGFAERLVHARWPALLLGLALLAATIRYVELRGIGSIGLNQVNGTMLALGAILHGSLARWMAAIEEAARGCAGILVQFPLYAGILAMLGASGLLARFAGAMTEFGSATTVPFTSFVTAGIINLLVPSGGGQWAIQGPIALDAARSLGIAPGRMVMSVAYGDQLTNMLQPFWALPLLAIARISAAEIVGYTALAMTVAFVWIALCLALVP
ncbi:MAG TPA: TIGR00366 family protein [Phycisphaerales bacterium]|nr:TIGR00366 family protein [Phycisphaerales bacterium]HMP37522.1 TIGR00366 family protein [Phycisphaerales bacterium]